MKRERQVPSRRVGSGRDRRTIVLLSRIAQTLMPILACDPSWECHPAEGTQGCVLDPSHHSAPQLEMARCGKKSTN
jgi:hypothetical protein